MFCDNAQISISGGKGGDGLISFRHEKFRPKGGPDGGDGGKGGDILLQVKNDLNTLTEFRRQKNFQAQDGRPGGKNRKTGKSGEDLILSIPPGTVGLDENKNKIFDLKKEGGNIVIVRGGKGGFGNAHYVSPTRRAPIFSQKGEDGEKKKIFLELMCIADLGMVGLPNSGKSTLLSVLTRARPKIAAYPFTTTKPSLGILKFRNKTFVLADIPGIMEGASKGRGLGIEFLKHIRRCRTILYLVDAASNDPEAEFEILKKEVKKFDPQIFEKSKIVVLTKADLLAKALPKDLKNFIKTLRKNKTEQVLISAATHFGLDELQKKILKIMGV